MKKTQKLQTQEAVIEALGGIEAVRGLTGANRKQAWYWIARAKKFPGHTYLDMTRALKRRNKVANDDLWNMTRRAHGA